MDLKIKTKDNPGSDDIRKMIQLADDLLEGRGFEKDTGAALSLYIEAAGRGSHQGLYGAGRIYTDFGEASRGLIYIKKAASLGNVDAMAFLGMHYIEAGDADRAEACLAPAAQMGNKDALYGLGYLCELRGDDAASCEYYRDAFSAGRSDAALRLGTVYEKTNKDLALFWFRQGGDEASCDRLRALMEDLDVEIEYEDNI